MNNIIVQEFNLRIEGNGIFEIQTTGGKCMIPMFGYDKTGKVMSRRVAEKEGYAPLEQKWIDKQIILSAENFRKEINQEEIIDGQGHTFDQEEYHRDAIPKDVPVYIAVIKKSDTPNEIGIAMDSSPMSIENSSISVKKNEYSYSNGGKNEKSELL